MCPAAAAAQASLRTACTYVHGHEELPLVAAGIVSLAGRCAALTVEAAHCVYVALEDCYAT